MTAATTTTTTKKCFLVSDKWKNRMKKKIMNVKSLEIYSYDGHSMFYYESLYSFTLFTPSLATMLCRLRQHTWRPHLHRSKSIHYDYYYYDNLLLHFFHSLCYFTQPLPLLHDQKWSFIFEWSANDTHSIFRAWMRYSISMVRHSFVVHKSKIDVDIECGRQKC